MRAYRAIETTGGVAIDGPDEDEAYELRRLRDEADAADALRAHDEAARRPIPQPCHACEHPFAGAICPICKEERPAFTALKAMRA